MIRIVFTGSESTGKTTLAADVARHYGVEVVPEFVRRFAEEKRGAIEFSDHGAIARGQIALEDEFLATAMQGCPAPPALPVLPAPPALPVLLLQDTDLLSTVVYCRHYFGRCPAWIEEAAGARRPDLYLLCDTDVPWVADGVRDRGHMRDAMQRLFEEAINASGTRRARLSGTHQHRFAEAIKIIDRLIEELRLP